MGWPQTRRSLLNYKIFKLYYKEIKYIYFYFPTYLISFKNLDMAAAIGGPPSPYDSSIYYYNSYEEEDNTNNGKVWTVVKNILIQTTVIEPYRYIIDVLTGNYTSVPSSSNEATIRSAIHRFLETTHGSSFNVAELKPIAHAGIKDDYNFTYFLERCSPLPILPVILGEKRYFIKAEIEDVIEEEENEEEEENKEEENKEEENEDEEDKEDYGANQIFSNSAFEEDVEAPQTLISQCTYTQTEGGNCKFIDPILKTLCPDSVFRTVTYIEKSKEDYDKIINRLKTIPVPPSATLNDTIYMELGPRFDVTNKSITKVIDVIQEKFGKHISLDEKQKTINDKIAAAAARTANGRPTHHDSALTNSISKFIAAKPDPVPLLTRMSDDIGGNEYFKVISFLRSYIDLYHDIETYATYYLDLYYNEFIKTISPVAKAFLDIQIKIINDSIFTGSGNVSQKRCREEIERITDLFIKYLHEHHHIKTNPIEKENARIISASIDNPIELQALIHTLTADRVEGFYVESANNNIGEILVKAGVPLYNLTIGDWDAGSGYSGGKSKPKPEITQIGSAGAGAVAPNIVPNMLTDMFGLFRVSVAPDNNVLRVSYPGTEPPKPPTPLIQITPRQKLSVNKLLIAAGESAIRGTEDTKPAPLQFEYLDPAVGSEAVKSSAIIPLKPWTDLIQIKTLSGKKILTIISDILCESTARMYELYHVLLCQGKIVTYYSYNSNSRNLTELQLRNRVYLRDFINKNTNWIKKYLKLWFLQRINTLKQLMTISYDPILFFISKAFIDRYTKSYIKSFKLVNTVLTVDIQSIPDTLDKYIESVSSSATLLADLLELYFNFKTAIDEIGKVGARGDKEIFLNAYKKTQQLIINTFKTDDASDNPITLRAMVASTFAYYFIKNPRYEVFLTKLDDLKLAMIRELYGWSLRNVTDEYKVNRVGIYYPTEFNASLPKIKLLSEIKTIDKENVDKENVDKENIDKENVDKENVLRSIVDIQIAIQTLLTDPPAVPAAVGDKRRRNNSGEKVNNSGEDANSGAAAIAAKNSHAVAMAAAIAESGVNNLGTAAAMAANNLGVAVANNSPATAAATVTAPHPKKQKKKLPSWPPRAPRRTKKKKLVKKAPPAVAAMNNSDLAAAAAANNSPEALAATQRRRTARQRAKRPPVAPLPTPVFNYRNYIINVLDGKVPTNPYYSFEKVIEHITKKLNEKIASGTYFGGSSGLGTFLKKGIADPSGLGTRRQKKLSKTHKKRSSKRKTYKKHK